MILIKGRLFVLGAYASAPDKGGHSRRWGRRSSSFGPRASGSLLLMSAPEARGPEDKDDATGGGLRRYRPVLRLLLFLVMLLAPDFSDSDASGASLKTLQTVLASAGLVDQVE